MIDTQRLRQKILDLAIRGKLVPQDPADEPASVLLEHIHQEKLQLVADGKLKKKDVADDSVIYRGEDSLHYEKVGDGEPIYIEDELPFELPEGWAWSRFHSLSLGIFTGPFGSSLHRKDYVDDIAATPVVNPVNIIGGRILPTVKVNAETIARLHSYVLEFGDLIIGRRGEMGRAAIVNMESSGWLCGTGCFFAHMPQSDDLDSRFATALFQSSDAAHFLEDHAVGVTLKNLNREILGNLPVPVPPIAEQRRVVAKLDELLSLVGDIERSQTELEELLAKARSKVLDLAIRGKLVPQDPDDEPASVLLERIHQEKLQMVADGKLKKKDVACDSVIYRGEDNSYYERCYGGEASCINEGLPFGLPDGWCWCRLSMLASASGGKTPSTSNPFFWEGGTVPWVTSKDMKSPVLRSSQIMMTKTASKSMTAVPPNSVLIVTRSGILRRTFPVAINMMETTVNQDIKALVPYVSGITWQIYLAFAGQEQRILARFSKDGTTVESIDFDRLYQMLIPVPPLSEQKRINAAVAKLLSINLLAS